MIIHMYHGIIEPFVEQRKKLKKNSNEFDWQNTKQLFSVKNSQLRSTKRYFNGFKIKRYGGLGIVIWAFIKLLKGIDILVDDYISWLKLRDAKKTSKQFKHVEVPKHYVFNAMDGTHWCTIHDCYEFA